MELITAIENDNINKVKNILKKDLLESDIDVNYQYLIYPHPLLYSCRLDRYKIVNLFT